MLGLVLLLEAPPSASRRGTIFITNSISRIACSERTQLQQSLFPLSTGAALLCSSALLVIYRRRQQHGFASSALNRSCRDPCGTLAGTLHLALVPLKLDLNFPLRLGGLVQMRFEHRMAGLANTRCGRPDLYHTEGSVLHDGISNHRSTVPATRMT